MSTAFFQYSELEHQPMVRRLRNHAALVRALLDELDRVEPSAGTGSGLEQCVAAQVAEEVARLARQMLEYAATIAGSEDLSSDRSAVSLLLRPGQ